MKLFNSNIIEGHQFLKELCSIQTDFSSLNPRVHPGTNRLDYILDQLIAMGIKYSFDMFDCDNVDKLTLGKNKFVNIIIPFRAKSQTNESIIFLAHHDIANPNSQNAQDNSASVCNLLHFCQYLKVIPLKHNIYIILTDAEEAGGVGARRLGSIINKGEFGNVMYAVNLELTGLGSKLWVGMGSYSQLSKDMIHYCVENFKAVIKRIPFSDTTILESNGIKSICIGLLPSSEIDDGFPETWSLIHTEKDTFDRTNKDDMSNFVKNILLKFL